MVEREAGRAQPDSPSTTSFQSRSKRCQARHVALAYPTTVRNPHTTKPPPTLNPLPPLSTCSSSPPNTRLASYAPLLIHSQRKSPVVLAVAMFSSVYSRNGAEEERQKCARDEARGRAARGAQVILLCDRVPEPEKWRRTRKASSLLRTWSGSVVAAQS